MIKAVSFQVSGETRLHCASCEQRVARVLGRLSGVRQVRADAGSQRIEVLFDPARVDERAIAERLGLLGYAVAPLPVAMTPGGI